MKPTLKILTLVAICSTYSCSDNSDCQECIRTVCGFVGCSSVETRVVCDPDERADLIASSDEFTIWECE